jgi:hypothetical protein
MITHCEIMKLPLFIFACRLSAEITLTLFSSYWLYYYLYIILVSNLDSYYMISTVHIETLF